MAKRNPTARKNPQAAKYTEPGCAYCPPAVRACRDGEEERRGPGYCPTKTDADGISEGLAHYADPFWRRVAVESARVAGSSRATASRWSPRPARRAALRRRRSASKTMRRKIRPGGHESLCNSVGQAELLNRAGCQLNVVLGLCVGHDSQFFKFSEGLATTLIAKDRVLAHNPIGALALADSYYSRVWGPDRPEKEPKLPRQGRKG
jgi:hypothetical protein